MTCIAAIQDDKTRTVFLAAERQLTSDGEPLSYMSTPKIRVFPHCVIATSGEMRAGHIVEDYFQYHPKLKRKDLFTTVPKRLKEAVEAHCPAGAAHFDGLLVFKGTVYEVKDDFSIYESDGPWAIGCGAPYALGYFEGALLHDLASVVNGAVKAACKYDANCGGKIDMVLIPPPTSPQ